MDLFNNVANLLQTQQSIGIEGLGTFYNEYIPGLFDQEEDCFLPPKVQILFKDEVIENELLVNYLVQQKELNIDVAKNSIQSDVAKILSDLNEEGKSNLYPLGILKKQEGQLIFEAIDENSANHTFFGLPKLANELQFIKNNEVAAIAVAPPEEQAELVQKEEILATFESEHVQESETVNQIAENFKDKSETDDDVSAIVSMIETSENQEEEPRPKSYKWLWLLVPVLLIAGGIYVYKTKKKWFEVFLKPNSEVKKINAADSNKLKKENTVWADSNLVDSSTHDSTALKLKIQANKYIETPVGKVDTFQVIVASFPNKASAIKELKRIKLFQKEAKIAYGLKGVRTKISIGTYTDIDSAETQQNLMKQKGFKQAWILTKKAN